MVSLLDVVWDDVLVRELKDASGATAAVAFVASTENRVREHLRSACQRLGIPHLLDLVRGQTPTEKEWAQLAKLAVEPTVVRTVKRVLTESAVASDPQHHWNPADAQPLSEPPSDAVRALVWASGHPQGVECALQWAQDTHDGAAIVAGVMHRFLANVPEVAGLWKASFDQAMAGQEQRVINAYTRHFEGRVDNRPDLAAVNTPWLPLGVANAADCGRWDLVRNWVERGGAPISWCKELEGSSQPWIRLAISMYSACHKGDEEQAKTHLHNYIQAGFGFDPLADGRDMLFCTSKLMPQLEEVVSSTITHSQSVQVNTAALPEKIRRRRSKNSIGEPAEPTKARVS